MNNYPVKVITGPETRFSYCSVWEPKSINGRQLDHSCHDAGGGCRCSPL